MSKSYNNAVFLSDSPEEIRQKLSQMVTDTQRARRRDPGNPDVCVLFPFHKIYTSPERIEEIDRECRRAGIGCVECKKWLIEGVLKAMAPIQEKRNYLAQHPQEVRDILQAGTERARSFARQTMVEVKQAIGF
jgi:tryptophanyl-tRNA synthetase